MDKEFSSQVRFYGWAAKVGKPAFLGIIKAVHIELEQRRWPWLEFNIDGTAYFYPWVFLRLKVTLGFIGLGVQIILFK